MKTSSFLNKKSLFIFLSIISIIGYSFVVFAAAPSGGYNSGDTLDPDCAPGDTDCMVTVATGGSSQWDDVIGGINFAGGNVGIGTTTPDSLLHIAGQSAENYLKFSGDSSDTYNGFEVSLHDNSDDNFGVASLYMNPEEGITLSTASDDNSKYSYFAVYKTGIQTYTDLGNLFNIDTYNGNYIRLGDLDCTNDCNRLSFNKDDKTISLGWDETGSYGDGMSGIQVHRDNNDYTSVFIGDTGWNGGNGTVFTLNDFDQQFRMNNGNLVLQYNGDGILFGENYLAQFRSGIYSMNGDQTIADFDSQNNFYRYGNGMITVDNSNEQVSISANSGQPFSIYDGGNLGAYVTSVTDWFGGDSGWISQNNNKSSSQHLISGDANNKFVYIADGADQTYVNSACVHFGIGNVGNTYISDDCFGGDIGLRNGLDDGEMAVYIPVSNTYIYGHNSLLVYYDSDGGFGGDSVFGINLEQENSYINFAGGPTGAIGSNGYGFRDNGGILEYKDLGGSWAGFSGGGGWGLTGNSGTNPATNFIGTTDDQSFVIKANNEKVAVFNSDQSGAQYSIFLGYEAGHGATGNTIQSLFFGTFAGYNATNASQSNFIGSDAGSEATFATSSNFIGVGAGYHATNAAGSNFIGVNAGRNAIDAVNANFLGSYAGYNAISANNSNFFGNSAGYQSTGAHESNFFGNSAGSNAINASNSNFFGINAGASATDANNSNFFGKNAGSNAINALNSNFIGDNAGEGSTNAHHSNFFGQNAGLEATNAYISNFFGPNAGFTAENASYSNFFGTNAGNAALNASNSNFFGRNAGYNADNAANSIFIGTQAGDNDIVDNTANSDDFSILLGQKTSTGGFSNSIAIGSNATNTATNEFMIGSVTRRIDTMVFNGGTGNTCSINASTGISCSSDERLKTNITDLNSDTLDKVLSLKTVTYNWKTDENGKPMIGFIAQDLQSQFPELVSENIDGMLSVNYAQITPVIVEAIREMNLKITNINDMTTPNTWRDSLIAWFGNTANGITKIFATEVDTKNLCVSDDAGGKTCITKAQLDQLLMNAGSGGSSSIPVVITPDPIPTPDPDVTGDTGGDSSSDQPQDNTDTSGDSGDSSGDTGSLETPTE